MHTIGLERVDQQHRDGEWSDSARHRRDQAGNLRGFLEGDIAYQTVLGSVDPDVEHGGSGLDPFAAHELGSPDRCDQNVGLAGHGGESTCARVAQRDRCVLVQQQQADWLAHDFAASDHDGIRTLERDAIALQDFQAAERGTRSRTRIVSQQASAVGRVQSVDVLVRIDGDRDDRGINGLGQRKLNQNAVNTRISVQTLDLGQ